VKKVDATADDLPAPAVDQIAVRSELSHHSSCALRVLVEYLTLSCYLP